MAASATFALKAGVWFRRGRLLMVSPDSRSTACPPSGRNSTYRPVQISGTGSIALARQGGLLKGLSGKLSLSLGIRSMVSIVVSFLWAGTWSLIYPPPVTEIPIMILLIVAAVGWIWHVARVKAMSSLDAIAALTLVLFIIAL